LEVIQFLLRNSLSAQLIFPENLARPFLKFSMQFMPDQFLYSQKIQIETMAAIEAVSFPTHTEGIF